MPAQTELTTITIDSAPITPKGATDAPNIDEPVKKERLYKLASPPGSRTRWPFWVGLFLCLLILLIGLQAWILVEVRDENDDSSTDSDRQRGQAANAQPIDDPDFNPPGGCYWRSWFVPCYYWKDPPNEIVVEFDIEGVQTVKLSETNDKSLGGGLYREQTEESIIPADKRHSLHEVAVSPFSPSAWLTHQMTNSLIEVELPKEDILRQETPSLDPEATRYVLPSKTERGEGVHGMWFSRKHKDVLYLALEFSSQVLAFNSVDKKIIKYWNPPFDEWGFHETTAKALPGTQTASRTGLHTLCEDSAGNVWFTMKYPEYDLADGSVGYGAIGRLADPGNDAIPEDKRWSVFKMASRGFGSEALPFYIYPDKEGNHIWFNSITTGEMGYINTEDPGNPQISVYKVPLPAPFAHTGIQSLRPEDRFNTRPSGMITMPDGTTIVALYNKMGRIALLQPHVLPEGVTSCSNFGGFVDSQCIAGSAADKTTLGTPCSKRKVCAKVRFVELVKGRHDAYLHLSADPDETAQAFSPDVGRDVFDLWILGSSNDFEGQQINKNFPLPSQNDVLYKLDGFNVFAALDDQPQPWNKFGFYPAPSQGSWLHRVWNVWSGGTRNIALATELLADRLLVVWSRPSA